MSAEQDTLDDEAYRQQVHIGSRTRRAADDPRWAFNTWVSDSRKLAETDTSNEPLSGDSGEFHDSIIPSRPLDFYRVRKVTDE